MWQVLEIDWVNSIFSPSAPLMAISEYVEELCSCLGVLEGLKVILFLKSLFLYCLVFTFQCAFN